MKASAAESSTIAPMRCAAGQDLERAMAKADRDGRAGTRRATRPSSEGGGVSLPRLSGSLASRARIVLGGCTPRSRRRRPRRATRRDRARSSQLARALHGCSRRPANYGNGARVGCVPVRAFRYVDDCVWPRGAPRMPRRAQTALWIGLTGNGCRPRRAPEPATFRTATRTAAPPAPTNPRTAAGRAPYHCNPPHVVRPPPRRRPHHHPEQRHRQGGEPPG